VRTLLKWGIILALLALAAWYVTREPASAVFVYGEWSVEMPLALFVVLAVLAYATVRLLVVTYTWVRFGPRRWRTWRRRRRELKARAAFDRALIALARGQWREAEKSAIRYAGQGRAPYLHHLLAAVAAHLRGAHDKRDDHLAQARDGAADEVIRTVDFAAARMRISARQWAQARATLEQLHALAPRDAEGLRLLAAVCERQRAWSRIGELLPQIDHLNAVDSDELLELQARFHAAQIRAASDDAALDAAWKAVPSKMHTHAKVALEYAQQWIARGKPDAAEPLLRAAIDRNWSVELVALYGVVAGADPVKQLDHAERWLDAHGDDPVLLVTLARLCMQRGLWGQAQFHLKRCVELAPTAPAYELMYRLQQQGDAEQARAVCAEALASWVRTATVPVEEAAVIPL
jgi:HemY protein